MINIVLHEPEIPQNTGNIGRTCFCTRSKLHLIHPLGFLTDEKSVRRAGMDYWQDVDISEYSSFDDFKNKNSGRYFLVETGGRPYTKFDYRPDDYFIFGAESKGLPLDILSMYPDNVIRIPMAEGSRSLNLAVSVGIITYEVIRQCADFAGLQVK